VTLIFLAQHPSPNSFTLFFNKAHVMYPFRPR
jgi:hypothetical protein